MKTKEEQLQQDWRRPASNFHWGPLASMLALSVLLQIVSCGSKDPSPDNTGANGNATINGQAVTFTGSKATDTGAGLEIILSDNSRKINITLNDKTANTYTVKKTSAGRLAATTESTIMAVVDGIAYFGESGAVVVTLGTDNRLSGTFDMVLKSSAGQTLAISNGKILPLEFSTPPSFCRITSITYNTSSSTCDTEDGFTFFYNGDGRLSQASNQTSKTYFLYDLTGRLIALTGSYATVNGSGSGNMGFSYSGNLLTSYQDKESGTNNGSPFASDVTYTFAYTGSVLTSVVYKNTGSSQGQQVYSLNYSSGNMTALNKPNSPGNDQTMTTYDTRKNPYALLAQLTGTPISFAYGGIQNPFELFSVSANNPAIRKRGSRPNDTFSYTYNLQNYPTMISYVPAGEAACGSVISIAYAGCQ